MSPKHADHFQDFLEARLLCCLQPNGPVVAFLEWEQGWLVK